MCPECKCAFLIQQPDPSMFICASCEKRFKLVEVRKCANCGVWTNLEPSGLCKKCVKELAEVEVGRR